MHLSYSASKRDECSHQRRKLHKTSAFVPYLVKYVFREYHSGSWRLSPSDVVGRPRALQIVTLGQKKDFRNVTFSSCNISQRHYNIALKVITNLVDSTLVTAVSRRPKYAPRRPMATCWPLAAGTV